MLKYPTLHSFATTHAGDALLFKSWLLYKVSHLQRTIRNEPAVVVCERCGVKAASILYPPLIGYKSQAGQWAPLYHEGPLECLHIIGKKATAWRMNQSIEPVLSLTSSLPFSLLLVQFSFLSVSPSPSSLPSPLDLSCHGIFIALLVQRHWIDILTRS